MTILTLPKSQKLTFAEFIEQLPDEEGRYELVNGEIVRILATRQHDDIADFIADILKGEVKRQKLNYRISGRIMIRTNNSEGEEQGRHPDVSVVDKTIWEANRAAYSALLEPLQLAVEVISTNWEDDYIDKLDEYQRLGIPEYWIVDYLALGSRSYLGKPKIPTVFVYLLDEKGVYQSSAFRGNERIVSRTFPELELTAVEIFQA
ncbi:Uma2 family endonuclease [Sphaerospermopsis aphanizomenoides BCCUSP55]|uniref:Uma2 family endonuclease n=1 Tax=Sphaerospermopsis aphanizomenoides TaxID=459663 RepID=UPI000A64D70A|nr:Uma2 family endonuclease [Sphaerospermopsis aphanizomenoides]MBK1989765.1 Uma2 family endonuclease [Sphaerospermopsis aphanizomenoides BCCUSP55]